MKTATLCVAAILGVVSLSACSQPNRGSPAAVLDNCGLDNPVPLEGIIIAYEHADRKGDCKTFDGRASKNQTQPVVFRANRNGNELGNLDGKISSFRVSAYTEVWIYHGPGSQEPHQQIGPFGEQTDVNLTDMNDITHEIQIFLRR